MKKYTRQDLATIDLALDHINEMGVVLKHQRDVMVLLNCMIDLMLSQKE